MGIAGKEFAQFAPEATRGTVGTSWTSVDLHGEGLRIQESRTAFEGKFASTFPMMTRVVKTGKKGEGKLVTPVFASNMQTMLEMAIKRTSGALDSFSWQKAKTNGEYARYLGSVCEQLTIRWGADDSPVIFDYDWKTLGLATGTSFSAGSVASGTPLMGLKTVVTVNGQSFQQLSGEITIANNLVVGPPNPTTGYPLFIKDGGRRVQILLRQSLDDALLGAILRANSIVPIVANFYSGVGTEELTLTMAEVQILEGPEEAQDQWANVEQPVTGVCQKPTAANDIVPTYVTS